MPAATIGAERERSAVEAREILRNADRRIEFDSAADLIRNLVVFSDPNYVTGVGDNESTAQA